MTAFSDQFIKLLKEERRDDLFPLLQTLDAAGKKDFVPALKKIEAEYFKFGAVNGKEGTRYDYISSSAIQREMLPPAFFVCYNRKDFDRSHWGGIMQKEIMDTILPWYCPVWFGDFVNGYADADFVPYFMSYDWYMELVEQGHVEMSERMIAKILPQAILKQKQRSKDYVPEQLLTRPLTLETHIWYIFENETSINWSDGNEQYWIKTFKDFSADGKIPRDRLLREALAASNRNFNQNLSGWFMELFIRLEPTEAELLELQPELFSTLNSPHSKPVNTVLKYFKDIATIDTFDCDSLIEHAPLVLSSESKNVVTNTLMILDKLARKHDSKRTEICLAASQALIHQDEGLQVRAAKLIQKFGDTLSTDLWEAVSAYQDGLLFEAKNLLSPFLINPDEGQIQDEVVAEEGSIAVREKIEFPKTFDEFVYLASQAFDRNETYHFDQLPAAFLKFQGQMNADNIRKLLPAFQRAFKIITEERGSTLGYLDDMLAIFMADCGRLISTFHPEDAKPLKELYVVHYNKLKEKNRERELKRLSSGIKQWGLFTKSLAYKPHKHVLLNAIWMLEHKLELPLLSTPTHQPGLIDINELIRRINAYQAARVRPGMMDYQVAVMRCFADDRPQALALADSCLRGEPRKLIGFILGEAHEPASDYKLQAVWLAAALIHRRGEAGKWLAYSRLNPGYLLADFTWTSGIEHYLAKQYNYQQRAYEEVPATRPNITVNIDKSQVVAPAGLKNIWNKLIGKQEIYEENYFDFLELKYDYLSAEHNDIGRMLYLSPRWTEHWLAYIINKTFRYFDFAGENEKRMVINTLETLMTLQSGYGTMAHLLIATSMVMNDKTVRSYAAELWIKGVREGTINSANIGEIIGRHEQHGLAPLKRFTDLLLANMIRISPAHNRELENLLRACIKKMSTQPLTNAKKLLDVYLETLALNKSKEHDAGALKIFDAWGVTSDTLKGAVAKIKAL